MRIAYGVMGYGRGHAMRTMSVLPALMKDHEITVYAGGDAYEVLAPLFPTVKIPTIGYSYGHGGKVSIPRTLSRNVAPVADLLLNGPGLEAIEQEMKSRGTQLVISDSEAWCHRAAQRLKLPRISFDHVGIIAYCKPHFPPDLWLHGMRDAWGYRALMGEPERILISSFYPATPRKEGTRIVGPMLRDEVRRVKPTQGEYLLAYFNKGDHQYLPHIDRALRLLDRPVLVYGTSRRGHSDNLEFRPPSNEWFIHDLAACHAVISTSGNQLTGEAIHFGKPILSVPERVFEQRLNAWMIERMGVGSRGDLGTLCPSDVDRFLGNHEYYLSNMAEHAGDGRAEAISVLHQFIDELLRPRRMVARISARRGKQTGAGSRASNGRGKSTGLASA